MQQSKPSVRWWWFAEEISGSDIDYQLDWMVDMAFGFAEIAWAYPFDDGSAAAEWLSPEWADLVASATQGCEVRGLGCDFTFGSLWPFGGHHLDPGDVSWTLHGASEQRLRSSWEAAHHSDPAPVLNHLSHDALRRYSKQMANGLERALSVHRHGPGDPGLHPALFCDSWEVDPEMIWSAGLETAFETDYGYRIESFATDLDRTPAVRYDYRDFIAKCIIDGFYSPFTEISRELGCVSRVQCHGAPVDLIQAYSTCDIPESEALLFDPQFSLIAASTSAQAGRTVTSCETFTCLYDWKPRPGPGPHQGKELIGDLKALADALCANGVNLLIWHRMPFNEHITRVSHLMTEGTTASRLAVVLPISDEFMAGELPAEQRRPSARWEWQMHHARIPEEATI